MYRFIQIALLASIVLRAQTINGVTVTASGIPNAALTNSSVTVNGQTCTLGSSCTVALSAVNAQTSTYQVLASDFSNYKTIAVSSGTFTITLVASGSQPANGQYINVLNYGNGLITIARSGQNINGGTSSILLPPAKAGLPTSTTVTSDGTNYVATLVLPPNYLSVSSYGATGSSYRSNSLGTKVAVGIYTSGATGVSGTGTCNLSLFNGGGTGVAATVPVNAGVIAIGATLTFSNNGTGYTSAPTSATISNGTAVCTTGVVNISTALGYDGSVSGTTVTCPTCSFVSGDQGSMLISSLDASGTAFVSTISSVTNSTTVTTAAGPPGVAYGTYTSGLTVSGSGTCPLTFTNGGGSGGTASIQVVGGVVQSNLQITAQGGSYTSAPTTASVGACTGSATASGTATVSTTLTTTPGTGLAKIEIAVDDLPAFNAVMTAACKYSSNTDRGLADWANGTTNSQTIFVPKPTVRYVLSNVWSTPTPSNCGHIEIRGEGKPVLYFPTANAGLSVPYVVKSSIRGLRILGNAIPNSAGIDLIGTAADGGITYNLGNFGLIIDDNIIEDWGGASGTTGAGIRMTGFTGNGGALGMAITNNLIYGVGTGFLGVGLTPTDTLNFTDNKMSSFRHAGFWVNTAGYCIDITDATGSAAINFTHINCVAQGGAIRTRSGSGGLFNVRDFEYEIPLSAANGPLLDSNSAAFDFVSATRVYLENSTCNVFSSANASYCYYVADAIVDSRFISNTSNAAGTAAFRVGSGARNCFDKNTAFSSGTVYSTVYAGGGCDLTGGTFNSSLKLINDTGGTQGITMQGGLGSGPTGDLVIRNSGGVNYGFLTVTGVSGNNTAPIFAFYPSGTGLSSSFKARMSVYNTDNFVSPGNFERLNITAAGTEFDIASEFGGTGTAQRPINISASGTVGDLSIQTNGHILLGSTTDSGSAVLQSHGGVQTVGRTLSSLPNNGSTGTCPSTMAGTHDFITDSVGSMTSTNYGVAVSGGGTNKVPVVCNGANWVMD